MRTREYNWLDMSTRKPLYGIQVLWDGEWLNAAEAGKPLLFDTQAERDAKRAEIRKSSHICTLIREGRL